MESLLRAGKENIEDVYQRHVVMLYRVAYSFMKNGPDAEDMVQEAFVRRMRPRTKRLKRCWPCRRTISCRSTSFTTRDTRRRRSPGCWAWPRQPSAAA